MADFQVVGIINNIRYLQDGCMVFIDEIKTGYKRKDGTKVDDRVYQWRCLFSSYFKKYINDHFSTDMLVQIKGEITPFAVNHDEVVDGYSILGQYITRASYPKYTIRKEAKAIKDSTMHDMGKPNVEEFMKDDF